MYQVGKFVVYPDSCSFVKFVGRKGPLGRRKKNKGMYWLAALYRRRYPDKWTAWLALQRIEGRRIW